MSFDYHQRKLVPILYVLGYLYICVAAQGCRSISLSILSKVIGPYKSGAYMGWNVALGTIFSGIGPFWGVHTIELSIKLCYGFVAGVTLIVMMTVCFAWKHLEPHTYFEKKFEE